MATSVHGRGTWSDYNGAPFWSNLGPVDGVAVHHMASSAFPQTFDPGYLRAQERSEVNRGYSGGLAYHRGIFNDGASAEIRPWGKKGAATGGHNDHTVAIVACGYFHPPYDHVPSDAMIEAIADEIVWGTYAGFIQPGARIDWHGEYTKGTRWASACAGQHLNARVHGFASIEAIARYKIQGGVDLGVTIPSTPAAPPRCVRLSSKKTLRRGNTGVTVRTLQNLLRSRGYDPGPSDGVFGKRTFDAVQCFQQANGLEPDGVVGPVTWAALGA